MKSKECPIHRDTNFKCWCCWKELWWIAPISLTMLAIYLLVVAIKILSNVLK